jgi:serine/threonine protein phosphatase 1
MTWRRALGDPLRGIDHAAHGGEWLDSLDEPMQQRIAHRLRDLPLAIEVETALGPVGIVHADFPYDDWQAVHTSTFSAGDEGICLWSIDRYRTGCKQPVRNVRAIVHGHMTLSRITQPGNVFFIDTGGGCDGGSFTLLNLHTLQVAE